jgi:hypothetical protein
MPGGDKGHHMALTKRQAERMAEAREIADLTETNLDAIPQQRSPNRLLHLNGAIRQLVIAEVVSKYTLLDEIMADTNESRSPVRGEDRRSGGTSQPSERARF